MGAVLLRAVLVRWRAIVLILLAALLLGQAVKGRQLKSALTACRSQSVRLKAQIDDLTAAAAEGRRRLEQYASAEAQDRGRSDRAAATDISNAFQRGVAVGRAASHVSCPTSTSPAGAAVRAKPDGVRDYRRIREAEAWRPGA